MPHRSRRSRAAPTGLAAALLARCREGFLEALREGAGEVIRHPVWLDVLSEAAGYYFDVLTGQAERSASGSVPASVGLVRADESDYSMELIHLDRRLQAACGRELSALSLRVRLQLSDEGFELGDESPFGTATVCRALRALKEAEKLRPAEALQLLQQIEEPVGNHLSRFYRDFEHRLADEALGARTTEIGIPPMLASLLPLGGPELPIDQDWTDTPAARASLPIDPVDALRLAVLARREAQPTSASNLNPDLAAALVERIEAWLVERHRFGAGLPESLGASELGALLTPTQAAAVEVIETVCAQAESCPELPETIRQFFYNLRLPLLRLALRSQNLLAMNRHPALRLVDMIANLGRTLPADCAPDLSVCRGLASVVRSLARLPRPARRDFELALGVLETLMASRRKNAVARAERHIEAALRLERREVALHQASRAVFLLVGQEPASEARNFIERYWIHVLAKVVYLYGPESPQWTHRVLTANRLLAAARPPVSSIAKMRMIAEFPALLHDLEEGLTWIVLPAKQIVSALQSCTTMHKHLLDGRMPPAPTLRRTTSPPSLGAPDDSPGLLTLKHKQYVAGELSLTPEWAGLQIGNNVAVALPNGRIVYGYVAHLAPAGQVVLISDGDHDSVLAVTARALAQQCEHPATRLFKDLSLVDNAALDKLLHPEMN